MIFLRTHFWPLFNALATSLDTRVPYMVYDAVKLLSTQTALLQPKLLTPVNLMNFINDNLDTDPHESPSILEYVLLDNILE